ncbi:tumor necrosis factor ligand superfamily member 6-like isoform X2 [Ruditapes philippinarum]|uniref:tumor necrosis factor ligand superfamily member 6-like isoform X2 n=1 Tax=Ruditapes philippinarum TaxID=129788 RepID=UPI00295C0016|nr:tumor necrosis factor ligand superfamily member 6-like isoform X2 [Ruditapes philippinarum]
MSDIMAPKSSNMCLPLRKVIIEYFEDERSQHCPDGLKEKVNETRGTRLCCGSMSIIVNQISAKIVNDKYDDDAFPEIASLDITAFNCSEKKTVQLEANLVGISGDNQQDQMNVSSRLIWNSTYPSFSCPRLKYLTDDGTIHIETSGYFYISSQLKSKHYSINGTAGVSGANFKHFIYRISEDINEQVLLEGEKSFCAVASDISECTSFIGAVFKLVTGDQIYVSTSHPGSLLLASQDNYFSIYSV